MKNSLQIRKSLPLPALPCAGAGWGFTLTVGQGEVEALIALGGESVETAPIQIALRPDGGLRFTHGRSPRFQPSTPKDYSSFGALNGNLIISTLTVPYKAGEKYKIEVYPDTSVGCYSVYVSPKGHIRPLPLANHYYYNRNANKNTTFVNVVTSCLQPNVIDISEVETLPPSAFSASLISTPPRVFRVGSTQKLQSLQSVALKVLPGDMVLIDADYRHTGILTLPFSGTPERPIHFKGLKQQGRRPIIDADFAIYALEASGHHTIFEGFEIINAAKAGVCHHCHGLVLRDCVIHNCLMGILSDQDIGMGDCEIDSCEVYGCGHESYSHQLYMATDDARFPGSIVRIHDCHIHDALGGNNIKSRALRNEIYRNKVTNAFYHNLELVGPDREFNPVDTPAPPHNSDVCDNYFENSRWYQFRCGGDGTGDTNGTFRFVGNRVLSAFHSAEEEYRVFRMMFGIRRIEAYNNTFETLAGSHPASSLWTQVKINWVDSEEAGNGLVHALDDPYFQNTQQAFEDTPQ